MIDLLGEDHQLRPVVIHLCWPSSEKFSFNLTEWFRPVGMELRAEAERLPELALRAARSVSAGDATMTQEQKVIRAKVGVFELAEQLGNASQACKMMGYSRHSFYRFKELYDKGGELGACRDQPEEADLKNCVAPVTKTAVVAVAIGQTDLETQRDHNVVGSATIRRCVDRRAER